jgi:hypothetical protein
MIPVPKKINLAHISHSISIRYVLIISSYLHPRLTGGLLISGIPNDISRSFLISPKRLYTPRLNHPVDFVTMISCDEYHKLYNSLL